MTEPLFGKQTMPTNVTQLRGQNIIAVASGKGGVGKTWLSITLAHALARGGRRALLFDGDLGLANVDIQLGLMADKDLGQVIEGSATLKGVTRRYTDGGFDIIAGRSGSGALSNLPLQRLSELRTDLLGLARSYDSVILDLGAGIDRTVRHLAGQAGLTLVVTTDEPTALTDAYAFIKVTHSTTPNADIRVVVNMAGSTKEGERTYATLLKACQSFLKFSPPLAGVIRRDPKVRDAIRTLRRNGASRDNILHVTREVVTAPELKLVLGRHAHEENIHADSLVYMISSLGLNPHECEAMFEDIKTIDAKNSFLVGNSRELRLAAIVARMRDSLGVATDSLLVLGQQRTDAQARIGALEVQLQEALGINESAAALAKTLSGLENKELEPILSGLDSNTLDQLYQQASARDKRRLLQSMPSERAAQLVQRALKGNSTRSGSS